jgi:hypothetical protein
MNPDNFRLVGDYGAKNSIVSQQEVFHRVQSYFPGGTITGINSRPLRR